MIAIAVLAYGMYYRRHGRRDLVVAYSAFNLGVFLALAVMSASRIGPRWVSGCFAVLSIIRLHSEPFANV